MTTASCLAADRQVRVDDIIGIEKIGQVAISHDGQSVAYLVVHGVIARDSYSISLVVTSSLNTGRHEVITRLEVPAERTQTSALWGDIGSDLNGGIVFAWGPGTSGLIYGIPVREKTEFFEYAPPSGASTRLFSVSGPVNRLAVVGHDIEFCADRPATVVAANNHPSDPAYRYDQATFHFWDKHPWQDGRSFNNGARPLLDPAPQEGCFERNGATGAVRAIDHSSVPLSDPLTPTATLSAGPVIFTANGSWPNRTDLLKDKAYEGHPATSAFESPDGKYVLFSAPTERNETVSDTRKTVYWVEKIGSTSSPPKLLFESGAGDEDLEAGIRRKLWAPDSRAILVIRPGLNRTRIGRIDIDTSAETTLLDTDWGLGAYTFSANGRYLYTTRTTPTIPPQLCRIDLRTGEMVLIDDINRAFRGVQLAPYLPLRQANRYGDELTGYLFYPPGFHGQSRLPFVAIKGAPWNAFCDGGAGVEFPGIVMAMKGFIVLFFEPSSQKDYFVSKSGDATYSNLRFESPIESIRLLISDLEKKGWVDPRRTGIAGLSYGADIVDYAAGFSTIFSVGSATQGEVYAPANYFLVDSSSIENQFTRRYGLPYPDIAGLPAWQKVSTSLNASSSRMPLLFQPGDAEAWVTIPQDIAWKHAGLPVETYVYPDEGHIKVHPVNRYYVMTRNLQWFDFWLRGIEDPRPEFADQFKRWEQMRHNWENRKTAQIQSPNSSEEESNPGRPN